LEKALVDLQDLKHELEEKIHIIFESSLRDINEQFTKLFELMFGGGKANFKIKVPEKKAPMLVEDESGVPSGEDIGKTESEEEEEKPEVGLDIEVSIPRKRITGLDMLSGGERSLVSIAALFALISVSPPPFLVLDEIDAALDERNARRFADMLKSFSHKTQFVVVTHNRATMEVANVLYGVTMGEDGTSRVLSLKLQDHEAAATK
jgi:chromosome segregation protein